MATSVTNTATQHQEMTGNYPNRDMATDTDMVHCSVAAEGPFLPAQEQDFLFALGEPLLLAQGKDSLTAPAGASQCMPDDLAKTIAKTLRWLHF